MASPFASNRAQAVAESVGIAASEAIKTLASYSAGRERDFEASADIEHRASDGSVTRARISIRSNRR